MNRLRAGLALILALWLLAAGAAPLAADPLPPLRRVNVPFYPTAVKFSTSAIFWFGQANLDTAYADVRIGYDPNELFVHVAVFDRLLWHATNPVSNTVTNWDSVTLYLNKGGNTGSTLNQAYRFDGEADAGGYPRTGRQAEYYGSGTSWTIMPAATFTTVADWAMDDASGGFNNGQNNRGYSITFHIPYASLGLVSGPPATGTVWGLAVAVHNRNSAPPADMQPDQVWPDGGILTTPSTWGQLYFGTPVYTPPSASGGGIVTIRNGLNGVGVVEAPAGGHTVCGEPKDNYWSVWGNRVVTNTYSVTAPAIWYFNVQNQYKIADWLCFSKYYTTFPLSAVPTGKVVISATLSMYQFGNAGEGWPDQPTLPSYIQILTVGPEAWSPNTLTWNNAPLARENVAITPVDPLNGALPVWRTWNVSRAVAEAYNAGQPLRLAIYAGDWDFHSGRYFRPSAFSPEEDRPTLTVRWGEAFGGIHATVSPLFPASGQALNYTLTVLGSGTALTLTDTLPPEVSAPPVGLIGGTYNPSTRTITWTGTPDPGQTVTVTFSVNPIVPGSVVIRNTAVLADGAGHTATDTAVAIVDPIPLWLSLIRR